MGFQNPELVIFMNVPRALCIWTSKAIVCGGHSCSLYVPPPEQGFLIVKNSTTALSQRNKIICPNLKFTHTLVHREAEPDPSSLASSYPNPLVFSGFGSPSSLQKTPASPEVTLNPWSYLIVLPSLRHVTLAGWCIQRESYSNAHMQILTAPCAQQSSHRTFLEHWFL